ncbi:hypothetical protein [Nocardia sp. NPDC057353]|uniref:hypothetical protein n=1 Tax=Nocardia sp. NPDC057353 TaxID=3346104 RepID=UPI003631F311
MCAAVAVSAGLLVAGCANRVDGTAAPNVADVSAYKTEAASSSAAATSSRKAAAEAKAISDNCGQFPGITGVGVSRYNEFVTAHDSNAPDYVPKRDGAADTLEDAANKVEAGVNQAAGALPGDLAAQLTEYVEAARALAGQTRPMTYTAPVDALNGASQRVNNARNAVNTSCAGR